MGTPALLADLAAVSKAVAATRSRKVKTRLIADYLESVEAGVRPVAVSFLIGRPRQSKLGAGWSAAHRTTATPAIDPTLTVGEVDEAFAAMAEAAGPGSQTYRLELLEDLWRRATVDEQSFLQRLIVRDLRQGATEGVMIEAIAHAAGVPSAAVRRATMLTGDPVAAAEVALGGGAEALAAVGLELFRPVAPMLATTAASIEEAVVAPVMVETKFDGARIQLHRRGGEVAVYTRNLNDITHRLPGVVAEALTFGLDPVVLDGEVLAMTDDDAPVLFQDTMQQFSTDELPAEAPGRRIRAFYFDVLHADGVDLIDQTLTDRRATLERLPERCIVPQLETHDPVEAQGFMDAIVGSGHEGVMVKDPASQYEAGRRGSSWKKIKPVYTFDLVVLGVEWGSGRRRGWLSNIHLGARTDDGFEMVGKTFKGMTDEMLDWQTARFLDIETHRDQRTVYVRPIQVVEVAIDGVQRSPTYAGGIALRFARVRRYRDDKRADEADTLDALRALSNG